MDAVRNAIGLRPNLMVMGAPVLPLLRFHPVLQAVLGANEQKRITVELMQDIFEIEKIVIGYPVKLDNNDKKDSCGKKPSISGVTT
ncbi:Gp34 [Salmonella enterica]|uniref:Gp34 n=1 Tax=Salmonella enterica TaxID=28901 RepID=A0A379QSS7_SALER|nr:Gp34 [Salmonella enterica]